MGPFVVEFYETRDGQRPAEDFLDELDIKMRSIIPKSEKDSHLYVIIDRPQPKEPMSIYEYKF